MVTKSMNNDSLEVSDNEKLVDSTKDIIESYLANNVIAPEKLPGLISNVHQTLTDIAHSHHQTLNPQEEKPTPAVDPKDSVTKDYLICLEDGKQFKVLKRHLKIKYNLTPEQYREKWGLDSNYPMVAENYRKERSAKAKLLGLGRKPKAEVPTNADVTEEMMETV